jgi:acetyl esterase/lipase
MHWPCPRNVLAGQSRASLTYYEKGQVLDFLTSKFFLTFRLVLAAVLVTAAALVFLPAPTHLLWMVALGVTEWGHWLTVLALALLILGGFGFSHSGRPSAIGLGGALLCLLAAFLTMTPALRAVSIARDLPSQLDGAFGPPASIPDSPAPAAAPLVLTDLFKGVTLPAIPSTTVIYGKAGGRDSSLDLYKPPASPGSPMLRPGVLVIHGGSWQSGDNRELVPLNRYLAGQGYLVASINYRLAPEHKFPAALEDVRQAISYVKNHAADLGLDAQRLVLIGRSAGGQLAMMAAYSAGEPAIRGVVALYAPPDLRFSYTFPANPAVLDSRGMLKAYLGSDPDNMPQPYLAASPFYFVGSTTPPTLLIHGGRDELVAHEQSERLATRLASYGRRQFLLTMPWATHACDINFSGPCGQLSTYAIERFLAAVTK